MDVPKVPKVLEEGLLCFCLLLQWDIPMRQSLRTKEGNYNTKKYMTITMESHFIPRNFLGQFAFGLGWLLSLGTVYLFTLLAWKHEYSV